MTLSLCITLCDMDIHLLDGLLAMFSLQTEAPDEIIISSSGILNSRLQKYNGIEIQNKLIPIKVTNSERRHFQAIARNKGAQASSCDLIMFFDVDDIPHPQKIEICKKVFYEDNDIDALLHGYSRGPNYHFSRVNDFESHTDFQPGGDGIKVFNSYPIHYSHITIKNKILKVEKFPEDIFSYRKEDAIFCRKLFDKKYKLKLVEAELVHYTS